MTCTLDADPSGPYQEVDTWRGDVPRVTFTVRGLPAGAVDIDSTRENGSDAQRAVRLTPVRSP